ncbi:hypothetical protein, partial [Hydrotalea sp.]|uniref:hypothetical protein n=1 Tax=Hydrotalea sp. TaxID=2881279 RepID=UPI0026184975
NMQQSFANITQRLMLLSNLSKYIFPLKANLRLNYSGTALNYFQVQNNQINHPSSLTHSTTLIMTVKPKSYFNSEFSINYVVASTKNKSNNSAIGRPINILTTTFISTYNFTNSTFMQIEGNYVSQKSNKVNNIFLLDMRLNHTIAKSKTDIGIKVVNIFNQTRFLINSIEGLQVSTNDYWVRPFTFL